MNIPRFSGRDILTYQASNIPPLLGSIGDKENKRLLYPSPLSPDEFVSICDDRRGNHFTTLKNVSDVLWQRFAPNGVAKTWEAWTRYEVYNGLLSQIFASPFADMLMNQRQLNLFEKAFPVFVDMMEGQKPRL